MGFWKKSNVLLEKLLSYYYFFVGILCKKIKQINNKNCKIYFKNGVGSMPATFRLIKNVHAANSRNS